MEIILLEKIHKLGNLGDRVNVAGGYGRNYLIPQGKAVPATEANVAEFEARRAELEKAMEARLAEANARKEKLEALTVTISAKVGDEGKLFGSIGTREIAEAVTAQGVELHKSEVSLPEGAIRVLGEHEIMLQLPSDVEGKLIISIVPEE